MIEVTVTLVPFGDRSQAKNIGKFIISNTGKHHNSPKWGNYLVEEVTTPGTRCQMDTAKRGYIRNHLREKGYKKLVERAFRSLAKW